MSQKKSKALRKKLREDAGMTKEHFQEKDYKRFDMGEGLRYDKKAKQYFIANKKTIENVSGAKNIYKQFKKVSKNPEAVTTLRKLPTKQEESDFIKSLIKTGVPNESRITETTDQENLQSVTEGELQSRSSRSTDPGK